MRTKLWETGTILTIATPLPQAQHPPEVGSLAAGKSGSLLLCGQRGKEGLNHDPVAIPGAQLPAGRGACVWGVA